MYKINLSVGKYELERYDKFIDRMNVINEILKKNKERYFVGHYFTNQKELELSKRQWIGYKIPGKKKYDDKIKNDINNMSNYLIGSKDFTVDNKERQFLKLKRIEKNNPKSLSNDEIEIINEIEKSIIYYRLHKNKNKESDFAVVENADFESILSSEEKQIVNKIKCSIRDLENERINVLSNIFNLKNKIKDVYNEFRDIKNKSLVKLIIDLSSKMKRMQNELVYIEIQLENLCEDYKSNTSRSIVFK